MAPKHPFTGVSQLTGKLRWRAHLRLGGKLQHLGYFDSAEAAAARVDEARAAAALPPVNFLSSGEPSAPQSGHEGITWSAGEWLVVSSGALYPTLTAARAAQKRTRPRRALNGSAPPRSLEPEHREVLTAAIQEYNAWADAKRAVLALQEPWLSMPPSSRRQAMWAELKTLWALERPRGGGAAAAAEEVAGAEGARGTSSAYWKWARGKAAEVAMQLPFRDLDRVARKAAIKVELKKRWSLEKRGE
jgi:hypothetical protein